MLTTTDPGPDPPVTDDDLDPVPGVLGEGSEEEGGVVITPPGSGGDVHGGVPTPEAGTPEPPTPPTPTGTT